MLSNQLLPKTKTSGRSVRTFNNFLLHFSPSEKSAYNDLVTETDQEVEKMLISGLRERFPSTLFIGEESVASGDKCQMTDGKTWIIDPIDGTTNFINSNPHICTILAFMVNKAGNKPGLQ